MSKVYSVIILLLLLNSLYKSCESSLRHGKQYRRGKRCDSCREYPPVNDIIALEYKGTRGIGFHEYNFCSGCAGKHRKSPRDGSELTENSKDDLRKLKQRMRK